MKKLILVLLLSSATSLLPAMNWLPAPTPQPTPTATPAPTPTPTPTPNPTTTPTPTPTPAATPTATPTPTVTPAPTPAPPAGSLTVGGVSIPIPVPEAEPYAVPAALRTFNVNSSASFASAVASARAGDCIILAPGNYTQLRIDRPIGTAAQRFVIAGTPQAKVEGITIVGASYTSIVGLSIGHLGVRINSGAHHVDVVASTIKTTLKTDGIYITNQNVGGFRFLNNWIEWQGTMTPAVWGNEAYAGINFQAGRDVGANVLIAGNCISRYHDGMTLGQYLYQTPSNNVVVRNNKLWDMADDGVELDGWHQNLTVEGNVFGGSKVSMIAAMSLAPGGPGPHTIRNNSISGYSESPMKFNTNVMNAETRNVDFGYNTIVQVSDFTIAWYIVPPIDKLSDLNIHDNTIRARGGIFVTENFIIPGLQMDRNKAWSTGEKPFGLPSLYRLFNGSKIHMKTIEELRAIFGFETNGSYAPINLQPVAVVPGVPVEKLCRWK